ncbi:MAG TPA: amino acid synthesis family protein [Solirubrobacterales bacterium]|nr:amino acid synthesis family protein [Solirubrobacterales bacterium]HZK15378.1 amino acid synthesis family protein [Solirubrobacterales bacterium]
MNATTELSVRRWAEFREEVHTVQGRGDAGAPLIKVAVCAVVENPCAGKWVEDLGGLIEASEALGDEIGRRARAMLGGPVESYGKGGLVGSDGEQENINAALTTVYGEAIRRHAGGGLAWIPSMTKRGVRGTQIDIPLAHKDALFVRSHYDGITVAVADAPGPDELVVIGAYANRGRINARVGGVAVDAIENRDGLR